MGVHHGVPLTIVLCAVNGGAATPDASAARPGVGGALLDVDVAMDFVSLGTNPFYVPETKFLNGTTWPLRQHAGGLPWSSGRRGGPAASPATQWMVLPLPCFASAEVNF